VSYSGAVPLISVLDERAANITVPQEIFRILFEAKDAFPVILHADYRPAILLRLIVQCLGKGADFGVGHRPCAGP
jgi:hypothetical protein